MHPKRQQRLLVIIFVLASCSGAVALATFALRQNINLFYTPTQIHNGEAPLATSMRVGGMVKAGSFERLQGVDSRFQVTDFNHSIEVYYSGLLPDLFREGQGVVARGRLASDNSFQAEEVLAKHDEKYMPPELSGMLKQEADGYAPSNY